MDGSQFLIAMLAGIAIIFGLSLAIKSDKKESGEEVVEGQRQRGASPMNIELTVGDGLRFGFGFCIAGFLFTLLGWFVWGALFTGALAVGG